MWRITINNKDFEAHTTLTWPTRNIKKPCLKIRI